MSIFSVGRVCVKIAGRDAGRKCVVVQHINDHYVMVDGNTRRKKVNINHLEPLDQILEVKESASHEEVISIFKESGWEVWDKKSKKPAPRPMKVKASKAKEVKEKSKAKKKKA